MTRLAEIYRTERSEGRGLSSTLGKRFAEKMDPRQLFNQQGLLAAMLPKFFKSYSATGQNGAKNTTPTRLSTVGVENRVDDLIGVTHSMAKDMNIIKKNVIKLVKSVGMTPARKADSFFATEDARESQEEGARKAGGSKGKVGFLDSLKSTAGAGIGKGLGLAALGIGIGGFLTGLALGGAAITALGGAKGIKDMLVNLGEGLSAFSGPGFLALGALLGAGMLFGAYQGKLSFGKQVKGSSGMALGIGAIGLGIGSFFAGLSVGGKISEMIGGSEGIKTLLLNVGEGLSALKVEHFVALGALIVAAKALGLGGSAKVAGGLTLLAGGITGFLMVLSGGAAVIDLFGGGPKLKEILVNLAEGLNAFSGISAGNLAALALAIPAFGLGMATFFGLEGIGGLIKSFTGGIKGVMDWIFGSKQGKTPMQQLAEDLKLFDNVNGDNLSKVGQGVKDLASGVDSLGKATTKDTSKKITTIAKSTSGEMIGAAGAAKESGAIGAVGAAQVKPSQKTSPSKSPTSTSTQSATSMSPTKQTSTLAGSGPSDNLVNFLKQKENPDLAKNKGTSKAAWDFKQYSIGYGTKASGPDEVITEAEADKRLRDEISKSYQYVVNYAKQKGYNWDQGKTEALASFVYNLGPGALKTLTNDGKRTDAEIAQAMPLYNKVSKGGVKEVSSGLEKRRTAELAMFTGGGGAPGGGGSVMTASSSGGGGATLAAAAQPSSGSTVASASSSVADGRRSGGSGGNVVVDNSQKTNVASAGGNQKGRSASAYDTDMVNTLMGRQYA